MLRASCGCPRRDVLVKDVHGHVAAQNDVIVSCRILSRPFNSKPGQRHGCGMHSHAHSIAHHNTGIASNGGCECEANPGRHVHGQPGTRWTPLLQRQACCSRTNCIAVVAILHKLRPCRPFQGGAQQPGAPLDGLHGGGGQQQPRAGGVAGVQVGGAAAAQPLRCCRPEPAGRFGHICSRWAVGQPRGRRSDRPARPVYYGQVPPRRLACVYCLWSVWLAAAQPGCI